MTVRTDLTVNWNTSPRLITVASPSTEILMQDLVDTVRLFEADLDEGMQFDHLIDASGKEALGGGTFVGITVKLRNAQIAFEARPGPSYVQCNIAGGNLVAVTSDGITDLNPVFPTAFTQVVKTSSSSATISGLEITNLQYLIESGHGKSPAYGKIFYWNPVDGVDTNDGTAPSRAIKTFAVVHALLVSGRSDVVMAISSSNKTIVNQTVTITKDLVSLRGPGASFDIEPTTQTGATITVSGVAVSIEGVEVATAINGSYDAISCTGNHFSLRNVIVENATNRGIVVSGCNNLTINDSFIGYSAAGGLLLENCIDAEINNIHFDENGPYNIKLTASTPSATHEVTISGDSRIHGATSNGIEIGVNCDNTHIFNTVKFIENANDILDGGVNTYIEPGFGNRIEGNYTGAQMLKLLTAVAQGDATGLESGVPVFKSLDGTKNRVTGTYATGTRTITGRDVT